MFLSMLSLLCRGDADGRMRRLNVAALQVKDPLIEHVLAYCEYTVAYFLNDSGPSRYWEKADIQGPVYLVRRRGIPRYQLLVSDINGSGEILDTLHTEWDLDPQVNYLFYKTQHPSDHIRGLWFHNDLHRQEFTDAIESAKEAISAIDSDPIIEEFTECFPSDSPAKSVHAYSLRSVSAAQAVVHKTSASAKQKRWLGMIVYDPVVADSVDSEKAYDNTPSTACPTSPALSSSPATHHLPDPCSPVKQHKGDSYSKHLLPFFNFDSSIPYAYGSDGL